MIRDGHIGYKEWMSLVVISVAGKLFNPSSLLMISGGQRAAWMMTLLSGFVSLAVVIWILQYMGRHPGMSWFEILEIRIGRWAGQLYIGMAAVGLIMNGMLNLRLLVDQIKIVTLPDTPVWALLMTTLLIMLYLCYKGLETIARVSHIFLPWLLGVVVSLFLLLGNRIEFSHLFPLLGPGAPTLLIEGFKHSFYFGEILAMPLFGHLVRDPASFRKGVLRGSLYAVGLTVSLLFLEVTVIGWPSLGMVSFPFLELARLIYLSRFVQHLEGIYASVWLMIAFVQLALDLYMASYFYATMFGISNFKPMLPSFACLMYILALIPTFFYQTIQFKDKYLVQMGGAVFYGMVGLLLLLLVVRKKKT